MSPIACHELVSLSFALIIVNPHNHLQARREKKTHGFHLQFIHLHSLRLLVCARKLKAKDHQLVEDTLAGNTCRIQVLSLLAFRL